VDLRGRVQAYRRLRLRDRVFMCISGYDVYNGVMEYVFIARDINYLECRTHV